MCSSDLAAFVEDKRLVREFREADAALPGRGMRFGDEDDEGLGEENVLIEPAAGGRKLDDAKLDASAFDPLGDGFRGAFEEGEFDERMLFPKSRDGGGQHAGADGRDGSDGQPTAAEAHEILHCLPCGGGTIEQSLSVEAQRFACGGEHGLAAPTVEKRCAEFAFKIADLLAERGLCEVQVRGGAREVSLAGGFEEIFELVEFHRVFRRV